MLTIGYDGRVEKIEMSGGGGPKLEALFRATVSGWRYEPGRRDGLSVKFRLLLQVKAPVRRGRGENRLLAREPRLALVQQGCLRPCPRA